MCRSLLSPQKPPDDLGKQKHVNNAACVKHWRWYQCPRRSPSAQHRALGAFLGGEKHERGNCVCCDTAQALEPDFCCAVGDMTGMHPKWMPVLVLTRARQDWLVVFSREQGAGLDLSGAGIQVHGGRCRNARTVFTLHPGAQQIGNAAVYQNADVLWQREAQMRGEETKIMIHHGRKGAMGWCAKRFAV